jgi:hypothetical protein
MRILGRLTLVLATSVFGLTQAIAQFTPRESQMISDVLSVGNYSIADLRFARQSFTPRYGLELCGKVLADPIGGTESIMALHAKADVNPQKMLAAAFQDCFKDPLKQEKKGSSGGNLKNVSLLPESLRQSVTDLVDAIATANARIKEALAKLSPDERRLLIESLPQWAASGTGLLFDFVSKPKISQESLYGAMSKIDLVAIRSASFELDQAVQDSLPKLRLAATTHWKDRVVFSENGVNVEVCGDADDLHESKNTNLCIDLGGRNRYTGRYGAGIGYAAVLIDFGTETTTNFVDASAGVGILGIGIAIFEGPRPDLNAVNIAFGAGLGGVGIVKVEQSFRMESRSFGQGFGMCGLGIFIGSKGADSMKIGYMGQGAGIMGGVGWLFNPAGNDRYMAGGLIPDGISKKGYLSRAQGFSGVLPGGIGLLTDNSGDDLYEAGSESQACATGLGVGSLYDLSGQDTYVAQRVAQAYASSEGCALLFDLAGDDVYIVRESECHAYAVDRSFAVVLDRSGNDVVAAHDSQPATAQEGSVAIYLDAGGADTFSGPVGVGIQVNGRFGIGLFVDRSGDTRIANGPIPGSAVMKDSSIAFNAEEGELTDQLPPLKPGSVKSTDGEIDELWEKVQSAGRDAYDASRKLNGIGLPAFVRFCDTISAQSTSRSKRVAANILTQIPEAQKVFGERALKATAFGKRAFLDIAAQTKSQELKSLIGSALQNEVTRRMAARYAAAIGASEFIDAISGLVLAGDALTAQDAVIAISKLGDEKLVTTMESLLLSSDIIIRRQAIQFVAKYPRGLALGKQMIGRADEQSQVIGIELLGTVGTDDSLKLAGAGLNSPNRGARIKAMTTLSGRVPEAYRARIIELTKDANPIVAAVAKGVDLGR